jgi:hypothetical protein
MTEIFIFIFKAQSFQMPMQNQIKVSLIDWQNQSRSIELYLSIGLGFIEGVLMMLSLQMVKALIYAGMGGKRWESLSWLAFPFCILNLLLFFALMKTHLIQMSILLKVLCWLVHLLTLIIFVVKGSQWADQEA